MLGEVLVRLYRSPEQYAKEIIYFRPCNPSSTLPWTPMKDDL